ncbi:XkdX family protein [Vallitalea guaymasensis]|nr:XkdX family protein [Vallitalea guaymasensis]
MFERLTFLYKQGLINETGLAKAVDKRWITEEQKKMILGEVSAS